VNQAWLREYGLHNEGLDRKLLQFNGFTFLNYVDRAIGAGAGRLWLEKYAYPHLVKNPGDTVIRAKLKDLYGYNDEMIDKMIRDGYTNDDIKRVALGAANWTTGSGRPSELPVALRGAAHETDHPILQKYNTLMRLAWALHSYMFKTANVVNRTVFAEGYEGHRMRQVVNGATIGGAFALAGTAIQGIRHVLHQAAGSPEAEIEKRRMEWIEAHPASAESLWWLMANMASGMALELLVQIFDQLATHDPKDKARMQQQKRIQNSAISFLIGPVYEDIYNVVDSGIRYAETLGDTGQHRNTDAERREKILTDLQKRVVPVSRYVYRPEVKTAIPTRRRRPSRRKAIEAAKAEAEK